MSWTHHHLVQFEESHPLRESECTCCHLHDLHEEPSPSEFWHNTYGSDIGLLQPLHDFIIDCPGRIDPQDLPVPILLEGICPKLRESAIVRGGEGIDLWMYLKFLTDPGNEGLQHCIFLAAPLRMIVTKLEGIDQDGMGH